MIRFNYFTFKFDSITCPNCKWVGTGKDIKRLKDISLLKFLIVLPFFKSFLNFWPQIEFFFDDQHDFLSATSCFGCFRKNCNFSTWLKNFSTTIFWRSTFNRNFLPLELISQTGNQAISRIKLTHNYKKMISRLID